jgi:hypothetical protein
MLITYKRYTQGQTNKAELKRANEQFVDILKGLGLGIFALLPFAPLTIPLVVKLGQFVGVDVLPSSFSMNKTMKEIDQEITQQNQQQDSTPPEKK